MSASDPRRADELADMPAANALIMLGLAAAALLAVSLIVAPRAAAWGWLIGFLVWSSAPIGAIVLALIHETTGGKWGLACAPAMRLGGLSALPLPFFFVFLLAGLRVLYPWASAGAGAAPDVARLYLNAPVFAACGFLALLGWAAIGLMLATGRLGLLGVSIALVFHGFAFSLTAVAWCLSIDPSFSDSAFGAEIAVQQIMLALAAIAAFQPRRAVALADGDVGGLLLATSLGAFYLGLMTFIVKWYGDQPVDVAWYLTRSHGLWLVLLAGAILLGAIAPVVGCAWERVRASPAALRAIGVCAIAGVSLHDVWLVGPGAPALAIVTGLLAVIAMVGVSVGLAPHIDRRLSRWAPAQASREGTP